MTWIVVFFLVLLLLSAIVRLVLALRGRTDFLTESDRAVNWRQLVTLALMNIMLSGLGLFLLFTKAFEPSDILIGFSVVAMTLELVFRKVPMKWR